MQQANPGDGNLVKELLRKFRVLARLERSHMRHSLVCGMGNHIGIGFKQLNAQQSVMIGRLVLRRNR